VGRGERLGTLEGMVLAAVLRCTPEANGVAVYEELARRTGRDPSLRAVHVTLRRLEDKGYLTSEEGSTSPRGGRPRRWYDLTARGDEELRRLRDEWDALWAGVEIPSR
jgi:PadR family transcriptional regulator, regulatory protein PadR